MDAMGQSPRQVDQAAMTGQSGLPNGSQPELGWMPEKPLDAILNVIRSGERFLVCSHSRPDGDAVGSMLAMGMLLEQIGKRADLVTADRIPHIYSELPGADSIQHVLR